MTDRETREQAPEVSGKTKRAWSEPSLDVIPAAETEASAVGPPTDGITGVS